MKRIAVCLLSLLAFAVCQAQPPKPPSSHGGWNDTDGLGNTKYYYYDHLNNEFREFGAHLGTGTLLLLSSLGVYTAYRIKKGKNGS